MFWKVQSSENWGSRGETGLEWQMELSLALRPEKSNLI